ncbi:MAG: ankyrin repeat domain-containing protein [candidate division WOR-3 bacterium]|nr:ankyrin repeat domain-containing protein [candidate division WOR-3 bacterium]
MNAKEQSLFEAINKKNAELVKALLNSGIEVDCEDDMGFTPLLISEDAEITKLLIEAGANINKQFIENGSTPLHRAKTVEIAKMLIDAGADMNIKNDFGMTPSRFNLYGDDKVMKYIRQRMNNN